MYVRLATARKVCWQCKLRNITKALEHISEHVMACTCVVIMDALREGGVSVCFDT